MTTRDKGAAAPGASTVVAAIEPGFEPVIGRYLRLELLGKPQRIYVEEAGSGIPLVCLHTAGSDTRQYRALMNDPDILSRYRVIAFDLPWHGKSSPPAGWHLGEYRLTSDDYVAMVMGVCRALQLDKPVVMGCSIGGRIVLHLALEHPQAFRALIEKVRKDDFCLSSEEHELGVHALAVPLRNTQGVTVAALNVVASHGRLSAQAMQRDMLPLMFEAARELRPLL